MFQPMDEVILDTPHPIWGGFVRETIDGRALVRLWRLDGTPGLLEFWCPHDRLRKRIPPGRAVPGTPPPEPRAPSPAPPPGPLPPARHPA
jgi:hypothetical protein